MPADVFIDAKHGMVFSRATGVFGRLEALDHMDRLKSHPDFRPEFNQLADFRQVTSVTLSHNEVMELASRTIFSPRSRRAFVVEGDSQFGIGRMFGSHREAKGETGIVIFRDMNKALAWLSLSEVPATALFSRLSPP